MDSLVNGRRGVVVLSTDLRFQISLLTVGSRFLSRVPARASVLLRHGVVAAGPVMLVSDMQQPRLSSCPSLGRIADVQTSAFAHRASAANSGMWLFAVVVVDVAKKRSAVRDGPCQCPSAGFVET